MAQLHDFCNRETCPFHDTIADLDKAVFKGNGKPGLLERMGNIEVKLDTIGRLIMASFVIIPVLFLLLQWGAKAIGWNPGVSKQEVPTTISATQTAREP